MSTNSKAKTTIHKILKNPWTFAILVTAVYFAVNLILTLHHEPYCDEAHVWLFSKNLSIPELFSALKADGHPPLFYLILMPFAKLGLPYITLNLMSLFITTLAVLLLTRYAPFPKWLRVAIIFSPAFTYFIPAFGRNYCLMALGFVLTCITYKDRSAKPIQYAASIALLFQSHIITAAPAGLLAFLFFIEQIKSKQITKKFVVGMGIIVASFATMALPLLDSLGTHGYLVGSSEQGQSSILGILQSLFGNHPIIMIVLIVFGSLFAIFLIRYPKQLIVFVGSTIAYLIICEFVYALFKSQQTAIFPLLILLVYWTA
jgi:hypothetical protein